MVEGCSSLIGKAFATRFVGSFQAGKALQAIFQRGTRGRCRSCANGYPLGRGIAWRAFPARDGRDSPLKYTFRQAAGVMDVLGMAGIHRSSTLHSLQLRVGGSLGMAGIHRLSTLPAVGCSTKWALGMAGIHRSSTLRTGQHDAMPTLGMAGIHRSSTLECLRCGHESKLGMAGIHRSSTL